MYRSAQSNLFTRQKAQIILFLYFLHYMSFLFYIYCTSFLRETKTTHYFLHIVLFTLFTSTHGLLDDFAYCAPYQTISHAVPTIFINSTQRQGYERQIRKPQRDSRKMARANLKLRNFRPAGLVVTSVPFPGHFNRFPSIFKSCADCLQWSQLARCILDSRFLITSNGRETSDRCSVAVACQGSQTKSHVKTETRS